MKQEYTKPVLAKLPTAQTAAKTASTSEGMNGTAVDPTFGIVS